MVVAGYETIVVVVYGAVVEVEGEVVRRVVGQPNMPLTDSTFQR